MTMTSTPSQTVGPFFRIGMSALYRNQLAPAAVSGERVQLRGHVFDGDGAPVPDAVLELWQADAQGRYALGQAAEFQGFGRIATDEQGGFEFRTIKPGRVPSGDQWQAPHIALHVFMRGLLRPVHTRVYFPGDQALLARDPVLASVPEARRDTLIARPGADGWLEWDIHLQGERETAFFVY
jgi:protocatechuate 3,4-dioxygenase alpha subunit